MILFFSSKRRGRSVRPSNASASQFIFEALEPRALLTASSPVLISEIMYQPTGDTILEEYVELHNSTDNPINLQNWEFDKGINFTFPNVTIAAQGNLVVAADVAAFTAKYPNVTNVVGGWTGKLSNHSDHLRLVDQTGQTVNELTYADEGDWSQRNRGPLDHGHRGWEWDNATDGGGYSLELRQINLPNELGRNWGASSTLNGTPGAVNSIAQSNVAPLIDNVTHFPIIPRSTDPVTVSASVIDEINSGLTVKAFYRIDGTTAYTTLTLFDDGAHGDGIAGDHLYASQIPAQADNKIIEFYVQATDTTGFVSYTPGASQPSGQQLTNYLYQVDDGFNPADPSGGAALPAYRLIMTETERAELESLANSSSERDSNALMNGTFISVDGSQIDVRYNVGIRNRGAGSRGRLPHSYRVDIPSDAPLNGIDEFNLNTQFTNLQLSGLDLFQLAGYPAEDAQAVTLTVNGADLSTTGSPSFGTYIQVETLGSSFVSSNFPSDKDGNLYRAIRNSSNTDHGDLRVLASAAEYREFYEKKTNETADDYSDLIDLIDKLNNASDANYLSALQSTVDIDNWLAYFAINAILNNQETAIANGDGDDYLLYSGVTDPRFKLIPHDFDTIFGQGDTNGSPTDSIFRATVNPTLERFFTHEAILPLYYAKLFDLLNSTFSKAQLDPFLKNRLSSFTPPETVSDMISFMDARREFILGIVDGELTINNTLPSANGVHRTTVNHAAVFGVASTGQTKSVLVNGELANWDPTTGNWNLGESSGGVTTLIPVDSNWQYLDDGAIASTAIGNDWRINDPGWTKSGNAQLGYGDGDEATVVGFVDTDPGASGTQKNITTYFRKTFDVADASQVFDLSLELLRDDGAVVYLNGVEVVRDNLPVAPAVITSTTTALSAVGGADEGTFFTFSIDHSLLVTGQNVLAVEIHQSGSDSSDISFNLELLASLGDSNSSGGITLQPGVTRLVAKSYSGLNGTGDLLDSKYVDVWYDAGTAQTVGGNINTNVVWSKANSPYVVTSDVIVGNDGTLTIEPGVTVFFNNGTGLQVTGSGRIDAQGNAANRIHMTHNPATSSNWDGIRITNTQTDNRFTYMDFVGGAAQGAAVELDTGKAIFDNVSWAGFQEQVLDLVHPRLVVSNSDIPGISGNETIHLNGMNPDEQLEFIGNVIGRNTNGNDVVDLGHSSAIQPTIIFRGNHFLGGGDDGIDTDGFHVIIENNIFENFHLATTRATTSNAVSTGHVTVGGQTISSNLELVGNLFFNNDHHLLLKDFASATLVHNTMYDATVAAISLNEPSGSSVIAPGTSLTMDGNIVWGYPTFFEAQAASTNVTIDRSIVANDLLSSGVGNIAADPLFVDPFNRNFSLQIGSPALGTGPGGTNMGASQALAAETTRLVISEINYNPYDPTTAETAAGFTDNNLFEFVEIFNSHPSATINLNGLQFNDGITGVFGNVALGAGQRGVIVKDAAAFEARYGTGINILGTYGGSLKNSGETITLADADGNVIASIDYGDTNPWAFAADGSGATLVMQDPAGTSLDRMDKHYSWRASVEWGGTPGAADVAPQGVVINEVLAHTDLPLVDSIELFNPTNHAINISGWYLSDSSTDLLKYQIPLNTVLAAGQYLVFNENQFNPTPNNPGPKDFGLNAAEGDQVWLSRASGGVVAGFEDSVEFAATFNGESLGRLPNGVGGLTRLNTRSFGSANGTAKVGPLVISEVNYHATAPTTAGLAIDPTLVDTDLDFVEIYNPTGANVDLTNWRIVGEISFDFASAFINASTTQVIVSFDPVANPNKLNAFQTQFGISNSVVILGPYLGTLSNNEGRVSLQQPDEPPTAQPDLIPHVTIDEVVYDDLAPWGDADGNGNSLHRISANSNGNLAESWGAQSPTPGATNLGVSAPRIVSVTRDGGGVLQRPDVWSTYAVQFDSDVNVKAGDLSLINDTLSGAVVDLNGIGFVYDPTTFTAFWTLSNLTTPLQPAFYRTVINGSAITSITSGLATDGDGNGAPGGNFSQSVYQAIPGDANLDGDVDVFELARVGNSFQNVGDLAVVKSNLGITNGATWADGDFNGDGDVDFFEITLGPNGFRNEGDLATLYTNLGTSVKPPVVAGGVANRVAGSNSSPSAKTTSMATASERMRDEAFSDFLLSDLF